MTAISTSGISDILQYEYGDDGIANTAYEENPGFAMVEKEHFTGSKRWFPVQYGYASNRSHTASTALSKTNTTNYVHFEVPTVEDYDAKSIQKKALEEAENPNTFVELLKNVSDSVIKALSNNAGADFYNHRGAAIGTVATTSTVASTVLTLADPGDITKFYVGQTIAASAANGLSGSLRTGTAVITAIDRSAGTITTGSNWSTQITGLSASSNTTFGDYLFPSGDFGIGRAGLADWCPDSASGLGTAFYGATRSVDASRLAGSRLSVTGLPISQAIRNLGAVMGREEGKPDSCFLSWSTYNDLITERDIKLTHVRRDADGMNATIGFDGVKIAGVRGNIDVYADRSVNDGRFYLVNMADGRCIHSQDAPVKIDDADGSMIIRESSDFTYDIRGAAFLNYLWLKPVNLGVGTF